MKYAILETNQRPIRVRDKERDRRWRAERERKIGDKRRAASRPTEGDGVWGERGVSRGEREPVSRRHEGSVTAALDQRGRLFSPFFLIFFLLCKRSRSGSPASITIVTRPSQHSQSAARRGPRAHARWCRAHAWPRLHFWPSPLGAGLRFASPSASMRLQHYCS